MEHIQAAFTVVEFDQYGSIKITLLDEHQGRLGFVTVKTETARLLKAQLGEMTSRSTKS